MTIIREAIDRAQLAEMAQDFYGEMIKGVVDVEDKNVRSGHDDERQFREHSDSMNRNELDVYQEMA